MTYFEAVELWRRNARRSPFTGKFLVDYATGVANFEGIQISREQVDALITRETISGVEGNIRDILAILNNKNAAEMINYELSFAGGLTVPFVLRLHRLLMFGAIHEDLYKNNHERPGHFRRGSEIRYASIKGVAPPMIESRMYPLLAAVNYRGEPMRVCTTFAYGMMHILPFADGNIRMTCWLVNYILQCMNHPPIVPSEQFRDDMITAQTAPDPLGLVSVFKEMTVSSVKHWNE